MYCIGVVEQYCQMVEYNTNFYKNGVILHACVLGRWKDFIQGGTSWFFQIFLEKLPGRAKTVKFSKEGKKWWNLFFTAQN